MRSTGSTRYSFITRFMAGALVFAQVAVTILNTTPVAQAAASSVPVAVAEDQPLVTPIPSSEPTPAVNLVDFGCVIPGANPAATEPIIAARSVFGGMAIIYSFKHQPLKTNQDQAARAEIFRAEVVSTNPQSYSAEALKRASWQSLGLAQSGYQGLITTGEESNGVFHDTTAQSTKEYLYLLRADTTQQATQAGCVLSKTVQFKSDSTETIASITDKVATGGRAAVEAQRSLGVALLNGPCGNPAAVLTDPLSIVIALGCGLALLVRAFVVALLYQAMSFLATSSGITFTSDVNVSDFILSGLIPQEFMGIDLENKLIGTNSAGDPNAQGSALGQVVVRGHGFLLGLVNTLLVIGFILVALANVLQIQTKTYELKKMLPTLVVGFIVANFSLFIVRAGLELVSIAGRGLFEVGNQNTSIITKSEDSLRDATASPTPNSRNQIVYVPSNIKTDSTKVGLDFAKDGCTSASDLNLRCFVIAATAIGGDPSARLTTPNNASPWWDLLRGIPLGSVIAENRQGEKPDFMAVAFQSVLNILMFFNAIIFFCLGAVFVIRTIVIYFLAPLSPIGFMGMIVPQLKAIGDPFRKNLVNWLTMPLVSFFWIWLAFMWLRTVWGITDAAGNTIYTPRYLETTDGAVRYFSLPTLPAIVVYIFMMICMTRALKSPESMAGELKGLVGKITSKPGKLYENTFGKQFDRAKKFTTGAGKLVFGTGIDRLEGVAKMVGANKSVKKKQGIFTQQAKADLQGAEVKNRLDVATRAKELKAKNPGMTSQQALAQARQQIPAIDRVKFMQDRVKGYSDKEREQYLASDKQNVVGWVRGLGKRTDVLIKDMENANKAKESKLDSQINLRLTTAGNRLPGALIHRGTADMVKEDGLIAASADSAAKSRIEEDFVKGGSMPGIATLNKQQRRELMIRKLALESKAKGAEEKESYAAALSWAAGMHALGKNFDNITDPVEKEMYKQTKKIINSKFNDEVSRVQLGQVTARPYNASHDEKLWATFEAEGASGIDPAMFADSEDERKEIHTVAEQYAYLHTNIIASENISPDNHGSLTKNVEALNTLLSQNPKAAAEMQRVKNAYDGVKQAHANFMANRTADNERDYRSAVSSFRTVYKQDIGKKLGYLVADRAVHSI